MNNVLANVVEKTKTKRSIHYALIIITGLLVSIPFFWLQVTTAEDGQYHLLRIIGLDNAIKYGEFPYLVYPFYYNDWGYSMTAFYPQIVTYIPYILGLISGTFVNGLKIFAALTVVLSGIFMYNFVNEVTKKKGIALFSAILYMIFPYRLEDIYTRFAIGEFAVFVFIPLVFQGLYNLLYGNKKKHYYITIGAVGILLSHPMSTFYIAIFCIIYIIFNIKAFLKKDIIKKCLINVIFILMISALFIIPMLEFRSQAEYTIFDSYIMGTNSDRAMLKAIEIKQFFIDNKEISRVSFKIGLPIIIMLVLGIFAYKKIDKEYKNFYMVHLIFGLVLLFMCTKYFPWMFMPDLLCTMQFPWRFLGIGLFFLIPVCAINVYYLVKIIRKEWIRNLTYIFVLAIVATSTVMQLNEYMEIYENSDMKYKNSDIIVENKILENPITSNLTMNVDNLPKKTTLSPLPYLMYRGNGTIVLNGSAEIEEENKIALHLDFKIKNAKIGTELELPFLFYPGYKVVLEDENKTQRLNTQESNCGFLLITIPENITEGKIIVNYTGTVLEKVAYAISAVSVTIFIAYIIKLRKNCKKEN